MLKQIISIFLCFLFLSCSDKYLPFKKNYQFKSPDGNPDYSSLDYWAAHPWKWDPSDSIPLPFRNDSRDTVMDVFFLHPTMYTMKKKMNKMNADIDDNYLNAKTDYSTILYQASVFNQHARIFAPRFREAHISAYFTKDTIKSKKAFDLAYEDIKKSFKYYLDHYNDGRPVIIASHSQGTTHALRLLKEYFENKPLQKQLVAAYIIGMGIPKEYFTELKICEEPEQTGCLCGWRTFRRGYSPYYVKRENGNSLITNPLTWRTDETFAPRNTNKGSILYNFNKLFPATAGGRIRQNVLWIRKPKFRGGFFYFTRNYHIADINLFYANLRENVQARMVSFIKSQGTGETN